jgi:tetraacyldisaccharide 4'-kinase
MAAIERHWYRLSPVSLLLLPLSLLYCALVQVRRALYRFGWLPRIRLPVPVVVVGNLSVGGTGKTPLVIWLAEFLQGQGYRPGIVTRGYRGKSRTWPLPVRPDTPATLAGDEAVLLARRTGCPVMAGPDRVADARQLLAQGCDLILSDDGLQHYRLARDIEIAVIDGERRFGNGLCLPAGPLREPRARLRSVHLRVTNGEPGPGELGMRLEPGEIYSLAEPARRVSARSLTGKLHAVAGIGHPERFFATLRALGLDIEAHAFSDHHPFVPADLAFGDDRPVILTEKDAVKCQAFAGPKHWALAVAARPAAPLGESVLKLLNEKRYGQKTA